MADDAEGTMRAYATEINSVYSRWFPSGFVLGEWEIKKAEAGYYAECARIRERYFDKPKPRKKSKQ